MRRLLVLTNVIAAVACLPAAARAAGFTGVVVARSNTVLLVAAPGGAVRALAGDARVGARVTTSAHGLRVLGLARRARVRGVLIRRSGNRLFLDTAGHLIAIRSGRVPASAAAPAPSPQPGDVLDAQVSIGAQGDLEEHDVEAVGHDDGASVQATVDAVSTGSITVSVDGQQLTLPLPAGLTLPSTIVGTQVDLRLSFANDEATAESAGDEQAGDEQGDESGGGGDDDGGGASTVGSGDDTNAGAGSTSSSSDDTGSDGGH